MPDIFGHAYESGVWGSRESRSGVGSNLVQTAVLRAELPRLVAELAIGSFLDIPCGDWFWMQHVELGVETYIGADVVPDLIEHHKTVFARADREFRVLDLSRDPLPKVDLIFCRDCLVHFSPADALKAVENVKRSGSRYFAATTFTDRDLNLDLETGGLWRPLNLRLAPFNFPEPLRLITEQCTEGDNQFTDKSLGVWRIADL